MKTIKANRGWGKVRDPETGEDVTVSRPTDVPDEQADRLVNEYRAVVVVDGGGADAGEAATESGAEDETFRCGVNDCKREVDGPEATCWQHEPGE